MGMYFEILFEIPHNDKHYRHEFFTVATGKDAWSEALDCAHELWMKLFAENKYWVLKEIKDITLR